MLGYGPDAVARKITSGQVDAMRFMYRIRKSLLMRCRNTRAMRRDLHW